MSTKHTSPQASQRGEPRPIFAAEDGGPIFPVEGDEMEHTWFLTEMSKRKLAAEQTAEDAIEIANPVDPEGRLAEATTATGDRSAMETATFVSMLHMIASVDLLAQADRAVGRDA